MNTKKDLKVILSLVLLVVAIIFLKQDCYAKDTEYKIELGKTVKRTLRDNGDDDTSHIYTYSASGKRKFKYTIKIKNIKIYDDYDYDSFDTFSSEGNCLNILLLDERLEGYAWDKTKYDCKNGESLSYQKTVTTNGDISLYISNYWGIESFDYELTVEDTALQITAISIPSKLKVTVGKTQKIKMSKISPSNGALSTVTWKSSNTKIATVNSSGTVTGKKKGTCTISATLKNGKTYKCNVTVSNPAPSLKWTSYDISLGSSFTNKLNYAEKKVTWSSSDKKIATVSSSGKVTGKGIGKCYINAKCNGKTYKCKVEVYRLDPNFTAYISSYNTRNNYFAVKIKNHGKKSLIIHSSKACAYDADYKSYDRNLKFSGKTKDITIKAGKSATVKFYVIGTTTWPDIDDKWIRYYFTYNGKKYYASVNSSISDTCYKDGKTWYYTYWKDVGPEEDW
jgi:uncharacterized protein YjdB